MLLTDEEKQVLDLFPADIKTAIQNECRVDEELGTLGILLSYLEGLDTIPGIPALEDLTPEDAGAMERAAHFNAEMHKDWEGLKTLARRLKEGELDNINPFLGHAYAKTDDRPNLWAQDTNGMDATARGQLGEFLKISSPLHGTLQSRFNQPPTNDAEILEEFARFVVANSSIFFWSLGENDENPEWRWGPCLCMLAGMGFPFLRRVALCMQHEPCWQFWARASDEELLRDVLEAHSIHGYPCGILRVEWYRMCSAMRNCTLTTSTGAIQHPRWLKAALAAHIFRHSRLIPDWDGQTVLVAAYRGARNYITISDKGVHSSFRTKANIQNAGDICKALGVKSGPANSASWFEELAPLVFGMLRPDSLARVRDPSSRTDILIPPRVSIGSRSTRWSEYHWVNPGVSIWGVARLDMESGRITRDADYSEDDAMVYDWPLKEVPEAQLRNWGSNVPDFVPDDQTPWSILTQHVKNINTLGHPKGVAALFNSMVFLDLLRPQLAGTKAGATLSHEFPIFTVLPMGHEKTSTTNQGKTFLLRIVSQCCVPRLGEPMRASRTASAPAQRATAAPIEEHGTAAYDEFILPNSREHFLDQAGIQNLSTGGVATPGRAGENSKGVSLTHPLFIAAKVASFPQDILNRMLPVFLDALTPETKSAASELEDVLSGKVSLIMRLATIRMLHKLRLVDTIKKMPVVSGEWRFNLHLSLVDAMQAREDAMAYLNSAWSHMERQKVLADASGLSDDIGISETFDPSDYWEQCTPRGMDELSAMVYLDEQGRHLISPSDVLKGIVEDNGRRSLASVLREFHMKERAARTLLIQQVRDSDGGWVREMASHTVWHLELLPTEEAGGTILFTLKNIASDLKALAERDTEDIDPTKAEEII